MSSLTEPLPQHDLPDWMRLARRGFDWGLLLVLALCLIVAAPFLLRGDLPTTNASENYVYRTNDYATAIQQGWIYPRWSPHVLGGYGAPIPNFYPPAAPYTAAVFQVLLTNNPVAAVRLFYVVATCVAGLAMYALVTRRSGAAAGILAAMLYIYSPVVSYTTPHIQGNMPHMLALALTPALLWAADRTLRNERPQNLLLVVGLAAALLLTDVKNAFMAYLLALGYALWLTISFRSYRGFRRLVAGVFLGVIAAGFYWIPAILEQTAIHWQANGTSPLLRLSLNEIVTPIQAIDPSAMVHYPQMTIGLVVFLCAVGGAATNLLLSQRIDFGKFFIAAGLFITATGLLLMPTETDLLGLILMCGAVAGSEILRLRLRLSSRPKRLTLPVLMITIWIGSINIWSPPEAAENVGSANGAAQVRYEQQGYGIAVLPSGDALPTSLANDLAFSPSLIDSYTSSTINKLAPGQISGGFRASPLANDSQSDEFQLIQTTSPTTLNILTAYFPGWSANIGEQRLSVQANPTTGLIQVEVPILNANNAELSIHLGTTDVRNGSWTLSGIILIMVLIWTWGKIRRTHKTIIEDVMLLKLEEARLIALPVVCFGIAALLVLLPNNPLIDLTPLPNSGLQGSFSTQIRSTAGLNLSAFRLGKNVYHANEPLDLTLFWQTQRFLTDNYLVKLFLVNNSDESRWNETALHSPGFYPTKRWNTQQYVVDYYDFVLENGILEGNYQIHVEAYVCRDVCTADDRISFYDSTGNLLGTDLILPTLISIR
ncbi:MAG: glycosyltransferase family 39 protein [Chloroflexi bacterium]|nr:glycosyltransferase family 39 protein [Chloroflexota bacterium]MCC6895627.1 glycosyltransferase family 39 protein [Anaerolineae bacterium]